MSKTKCICKWCGSSYYVETINDYNEHNGRSYTRNIGKCGCVISEAMKSFTKQCSNCIYYKAQFKCNNDNNIKQTIVKAKDLGIGGIEIISLDKKPTDECINWKFNINIID